MKAELTYQEISNIIENKSGRVLSLSYGGPRTVRVIYDSKILFKTVSVGIDLTVESIEGSDIYIAYSGGAGIDFVVKHAIPILKNHPISKLIEPLEGNRIRLCMSKNAKVGAILDQIDLEDISFNEQYAIVQVSVKS